MILNKRMSDVHPQNPCETQKENNGLKMKVEELTNDVNVFIKFTETFLKISCNLSIIF